jgi:methylmalonyl-CoA mutase cobalamin-binding subunit
MRRGATDKKAVASESVRSTFTAALDALIDQVKADRSILAAILCGSLSHDTVWAKSDIDLALITVDDRKLDTSHMALYANGVNVHAFLMPRTAFRQLVDRSTHNSFAHAVLAKGRLLYTHDDTIADMCARLREVGARDIEVQLLNAGTSALGSIYKAHKWSITRGDLDYTALWILYAATSLAQIEVLQARQIVDREVIPQALKLNPAFFEVVYTQLLNTKKTRAAVDAALAAVDAYIDARARTLFRPVIDHLREVGEARSCSEIEAHFSRHFDLEGATTACEYLTDRGLIGKVSVSSRLTKKSNVDVQELAFVYVSGGE